jgi:hypothetical protein
MPWWVAERIAAFARVLEQPLEVEILPPTVTQEGDRRKARRFVRRCQLVYIQSQRFPDA